MIASKAIALCLSYIVGLLCTNWLAYSGDSYSRSQLFLVALTAAAISAIATLIISILAEGMPRRFQAIASRLRLDYQLYLSVILIALVAVVYWQLRLPQPEDNDISYQVAASESNFVTVSGQVLSEPRLNDDRRLKFVLQVREIGDGEPVAGKVYATLPLLQGTGLHPGTKLKLGGVLYLPQGANRSGAFDFQAYLARQGIFAGIQGFTADFESESGWGWWQLRQRIVRSQLRGLGSPVGQLVSSMVLGRKAVDLSPKLRDRFIEAGLAHVLAASGFHVSLLLGIILKLTARLTVKPRLIIGIGTLVIYLGLTGVQASVFRACLMGVAVLIALAMETKVKPLGSLLLAATIILLFKPLFISDLGFQLSFLATFGLIVTMPGLQKRLDWLPPTIAVFVAVPLAASVWVLPLLSYGFNRVAVYSLAINIISTPLIMLVSLGGMVSAIAALVLPIAGSAIAWLLYYPALLLISIIYFFTNLPGSSWAIGQISLGALLIIYGLYILVWLNQWWRDRLTWIFLFVSSLIIVPLAYQHFNLTQITILPGKTEPIFLVQDRGEAVLINSGTAKIAKYSVIPLLNERGINQIDYGIDFNLPSNRGWQQISDRLNLQYFISHPNSESSVLPVSQKTLTQNSSQAIATKSFKISFDHNLDLLRLETVTSNWLILSNSSTNIDLLQKYIQANNLTQKTLILICKQIPESWLEIQPQIVISLTKPKNSIPRDRHQTQFYSLQQDGAIAWTFQNGIKLLKDDRQWD